MKKLIHITPLIIILLVSGCCIFKKHKTPTDESVYFDSEGGEHTFSNGITLKIPPGALTEERNIFIKNITEDEMSSLLNIRNVPEEEILFAFKTFPDNIEFESPVSISIPVSGLTTTMMPLIMQINFSENSVSVANVSYIVDSENKTIELSVNHFSGYEAEIADEVRRNECTDPSTSCRCLTIEVTQTDAHYSCSVGDCQVVYSENSVEFLDCPGSPVESSIFEEVTPGCEPDLLISSEKVYIEEGETCEITAQLKLGCAPITTRNVTFSVSGPGTINPDNDFTDDEGEAHATITGGSEEGIITVTALSSFTYNTKRINVNGVDLVLEEQSTTLTNSVVVYVIKKPALNLAASDAVIPKNSNTSITATVTRDEVPVEGALVDFSIVGPADIDPLSAHTSNSGQAVTQLYSHNSQGTVNVLAKSDILVDLPDGNNILIPLQEVVNVIIEEEEDNENIVSLWTFNYHYATTIPAENEPKYQHEESNIADNIQGFFRIVEVESVINVGTPYETTIIEYQIEGSATGMYMKNEGAWRLVNSGFYYDETTECPGVIHSHSATYQLAGYFHYGRINLHGNTNAYDGHDDYESVEVGTCNIEYWDQVTDEHLYGTEPNKIDVSYMRSFSFDFDEDDNWVYLDFIGDDGRTVHRIWASPIE